MVCCGGVGLFDDYFYVCFGDGYEGGIVFDGFVSI